MTAHEVYMSRTKGLVNDEDYTVVLKTQTSYNILSYPPFMPHNRSFVRLFYQF